MTDAEFRKLQAAYAASGQTTEAWEALMRRYREYQA